MYSRALIRWHRSDYDPKKSQEWQKSPNLRPEGMQQKEGEKPCPEAEVCSIRGELPDGATNHSGPEHHCVYFWAALKVNKFEARESGDRAVGMTQWRRREALV